MTPLKNSLCRLAVTVAACMTATALWLASSTAAAQSVSGDVLDLDQAAALLRVKPEVVQALAESHSIPARRDDGDRRRQSGPHAFAQLFPLASLAK